MLRFKHLALCAAAFASVVCLSDAEAWARYDLAFPELRVRVVSSDGKPVAGVMMGFEVNVYKTRPICLTWSEGPTEALPWLTTKQALCEQGRPSAVYQTYTSGADGTFVVPAFHVSSGKKRLILADGGLSWMYVGVPRHFTHGSPFVSDTTRECLTLPSSRWDSDERTPRVSCSSGRQLEGETSLGVITQAPADGQLECRLDMTAEEIATTGARDLDACQQYMLDVDRGRQKLVIPVTGIADMVAASLGLRFTTGHRPMALPMVDAEHGSARAKSFATGLTQPAEQGVLVAKPGQEPVR